MLKGLWVQIPPSAPVLRRHIMTIVLGIIAVLIFASVALLYRFMQDMAKVEKDLLKEIKEMKQCLVRINEKQL